MPTITTTDGKVLTVPQDDGPWSMTLDDPSTGSSSSGKQGITDPSVSGTTTPTVTPATTGSSSVSTTPPPSTGSTSTSGDSTTPDPGLTSSDPETRIDALYKQAGISDGGRGSGFADRAYWLEHPDQILNGRLAADLAGTGTDQPTGTPGYGAWLNSGRNAPEASIGDALRKQYGGGFTPGTPAAMGSTDPGAGIPWAPGASAPQFAPPGYQWDPQQARFRLISELKNQTPTPPGASQVTQGASTPGGSTPPSQTGVPYAVSPNFVSGGAGGVTPVDPNDPFSAKP